VGEGAYGEVFRVLHLSFDKLFAIKQVNKRQIEKVTLV